MRFLPVLFVLSCFSVGCDDSTGGGVGGGGGEDMAVPADMTMAVMPPDLAMTAPKALGCAGVLQCLMGGTSQAACLMKATPKALSLLTAMLDCGHAVCGTFDGGPGSCADAQDQTPECYQCIGQELQGGACGAETQACFSDQ